MPNCVVKWCISNSREDKKNCGITFHSPKPPLKMSTSPFPYTCELCGAEGLTDDGMRSHTLEAHVTGRPECPFCDAAVPQNQLVVHVEKVHLHYLTPERELMAFIDDQSPSFDEDSKMTNTDSYYTPGSMNGWHSPDVSSSSHNGAISKNISQQNGGISKSFQNGDRSKDSKHSPYHDGKTKSPKNINLTNGLKNINLCNGGVRPKVKSRSRDSSSDGECGQDAKNARNLNGSPQNNERSYEGSPNKNKLMASAGQGSPLRSQLALKLKPNTPKKYIPTPPNPTVQCLLCEFTSTCPRKLEEHINRAHFDLTSPSVITTNSNVENPTLSLTTAMAWTPAPCSSNPAYQCPLCVKDFASGSEVELHCNIEHRDILSPEKTEIDNAKREDEITVMEESPVSHCPVCDKPLPLSQHALIAHIDSHFEHSEAGAAALTEEQRREQRTREEQEFQMLKAQYGMDEDDYDYQGHEQNKLKTEVYKGQLSVAGYYAKSVGLKEASATGKDTGGSMTTGLIEKISVLNNNTPTIYKTYLCSEVDHYASTYSDRGWGCGYRNLQMVLSSLLRHPQYGNRLASMRDGDATAPSIPALQCLVERAWGLGFDTQGAEQLGNKLCNTRKWIGACEVVTVLSSFRIRCQLIDFHRPTAVDGSHPALFDWVLRYFEKDAHGFKPPLYLQHQGHSRTIIGYERHRDGKATLLVLDPSHSPAQVRAVLCGKGAVCASALRLLRRGAPALKAKQYQLAAVAGLMGDEKEYEEAKVLQSIRIP